MRIERFYRKGLKYPYTVSEKYYKQLQKEGREYIDNALQGIVLESDEEEREWFFDCCQRVINNPRFYLDNLDRLCTFRVGIKKIFPDKILD